MEHAPNESEPLYKRFAEFDPDLKAAIASIKSPLQLGLVALQLAYDHVGLLYLSAEEISNALECAGVAVDSKQIEGAFSRAKGAKVKRRDFDELRRYRLMTAGRQETEPLLEVGNLRVVFVEGDRPRQARRKLGDLLRGLQGTLRVIDPYFGVRTLDTLDLFPKGTKVLLLTATLEKMDRLAGPLADFKKENSHVEMRRHSGPELHDRYVLTDEGIFIIGHGLKDIGARESFIISIDKGLAADLLIQIKESFDEKWSHATPL